MSKNYINIPKNGKKNYFDEWYYCQRTCIKGGFLKNKLIITLTAAALSIIIVSVSFFIFTDKEEKDFMKKKHTVDYLSTAIRVMSDSDFTDFDLASRIYLHAFSNSAKIDDTFGETADDIVNGLLLGDVNDEVLKSIAYYGGSSFNKQITRSEISPSEQIDNDCLYVGDLLVYKKGDTAKLFIKDKENFVDLSDATQKVEISAVLNEANNSEIFVGLRPMKIMEDYDFITEDLPKLALDEAQKAIIATAESYLLRGDKLQYADTRLGGDADAEFRWKTGVKAPEDATDDDWGFTNCAAFTYDVYYHSLGINMEYSGNKLNTTANYARYSKELGISKYSMLCKNADEYTEQEKTKIINEITDILQPADILVVRRAGGGGHAMLYVGNGNIIHSTGSVYNVDEAKENYEASIRRMRLKSYLFTEGTTGYIFGADKGKEVISFTIVRPLDKWKANTPEFTQKHRVENLSGVMAQKLCSHNNSKTVNPGEEITYTFEVYNVNDNQVRLDITDTVPDSASYISGAQKVENNKLSWKLVIPANTRKSVSYKVKVNPEALIGTTIKSEESYVGGVPVRCNEITVKRTLNGEEQSKILTAIQKVKNEKELSAFELVNKIYKTATGTNDIFKDNDFNVILTDSLDGVFCAFGPVLSSGARKHSLNEGGMYKEMMLVPTLYGGRNFFATQWTARTRLPREHNLVIGDILVRKTLENEQVMIYAGNGLFYDLSDGVKPDSLTVKRRLETCLATGNCYAILRPSFVLK